MSIRKILFLALAVVVFFQFSPGCIFDPTVVPKEKLKYLARTSPENVIYNVTAAFQNQEFLPYSEQLCDGYVFRGILDENTNRQDSLILAEELNFAENLFQRGSSDRTQKPATSIKLVIITTSKDPDPRVGHEGWIRYVVQTSLKVNTADGGEIVVNSPALLYLRPDPGATWCLAEWQDERSAESSVNRVAWALGSPARTGLRAS